MSRPGSQADNPRLLRPVAREVARGIGHLIPNPSDRFGLLDLGVEHGGGPAGDGLGPAAEARHVAGGGGRLGASDEPGDVFQRLIAVHEERRQL